MRGACKRAESECRFAHPQDSVTTHEDGSVTVCMDAVKGRCAREPCRYFHPPLHLQAQIKAAQSRATAVWLPLIQIQKKKTFFLYRFSVFFISVLFSLILSVSRLITNKCLSTYLYLPSDIYFPFLHPLVCHLCEFTPFVLVWLFCYWYCSLKKKHLFQKLMVWIFRFTNTTTPHTPKCHLPVNCNVSVCVLRHRALMLCSSWSHHHHHYPSILSFSLDPILLTKI